MLLFETCKPDSRSTFGSQKISLLLPVVIHKQQQEHLVQVKLPASKKDKEHLQIVTGLEKLGSVSAHLDHSLADEILFTAQYWELTSTSWVHDPSTSCREKSILGICPHYTLLVTGN